MKNWPEISRNPPSPLRPEKRSAAPSSGRSRVPRRRRPERSQSPVSARRPRLPKAREKRTGVSVIISTIGSKEKAREIAYRLVESRRAACVNIVPGIRSIYRWKGRIEDDAELLLIIKTSSARAKEAMKMLRELHPYEIPEMLLLEVSQGFAPYLQWVMESAAD